MPLLRIAYTRPDDTLPPPQDLGRRLTEVILCHHALSRWSEQLRTMFRVSLHEVPVDHFLRGGQPSQRALYEIEYMIPAETLTNDVRDAVAESIARAVLAWEGHPWDSDDAMRVMLFVTDVPHDRWFCGGRFVTPRSIIAYIGELRRESRRAVNATMERMGIRQSA